MQGKPVITPSPTRTTKEGAHSPDTVTTLIYLHSDHLGSVSVATNESGAVVSQQEYDPWGRVRPGGGAVTQTRLNYTGQRLDATGLLYYHAGYYDPVLARFVSPDTIVPGAASGVGGAGGTVGAWQNSRLTVDFHESGSLNSVKKENQLTLQKGFWFQLSEEEQERSIEHWGPDNPQALNRYSYAENNPIVTIDPDGHYSIVGRVGTQSWKRFRTNLTYNSTQYSNAAYVELMALAATCLTAAPACMIIANTAWKLINDDIAAMQKMLDDAETLAGEGAWVHVVYDEKTGDVYADSFDEQMNYKGRTKYKGGQGLTGRGIWFDLLVPAVYQTWEEDKSAGVRSTWLLMCPRRECNTKPTLPSKPPKP